MALKRVTMQDIAEACGLSRNTVSKVFNDRGAVPEATKKLVLSKAQELGYYQPPEELSEAVALNRGNIALLTQHKLMSHNFGVFFNTSFTDQISRSGYTIKIYEISSEELAEKRLPPHLKLEETAGILGIELFDRDYLDMICSLGIPTVFVDGYARIRREAVASDFVSMENVTSVRELVNRMIRAGARRIGFVGDIEHCNSFYERWFAYAFALRDAGLPLDRELCILAPDSAPYGETDWLLAQLDAMPELPDAFVCANDYLAIRLMTALKKRGLRIPEDVMVAGFDGSPEAGVVEPPLTTARIPTADIGRLAATMLINRITAPDRPFYWIYVQTSPVWGGSTR